MKHKNNFDLIRLLAAFQVLYMHSHAWIKPTGVPGWLHATLSMFPGVAIFFMVSGFLIAGSYLKPKATLASFAVNRALRIYPALWVNLTSLLALLAITGSLRYSPLGTDFWQWVAIAFPTGSDWIATNAVGSVMNGSFFSYFPSGVLWTIPVEMSFYLLVPLIFAKQLQSRGLLGCSVLLWATASLIIYWNWDLRSHPYQIGKYLWFFLIGSAIKVYWHRLSPFLSGKVLFWFPAYIAAAWAVFIVSGQLYFYPTASAPTVALTLLLACAVFSLAHTAHALSKWLVGNDISYGLYLWHMPVIWVFVALGHTGSWWYAVTASAIAVCIAWLSWRFIEAPSLRLKTQRHQVRVAVPS